MGRLLLFFLASLVVLLTLLAAPTYALQEPTAVPQGLSEGWSGPGFYFSLWKLITLVVIFLLWVATTDWVNRDILENDFDYKVWNPVVVFSFIGALLLALVIPIFFVGLPLLLLAWAVPLGAYIGFRNKRVDPSERVLTKAHFRRLVAQLGKPAGVKIEAEPVDPRDAGVPVTLAGRGGPTPRDDNARLLAARQAPGYNDLRRLLYDAVKRRAESILLDYTQQGVSRRHLVDGVWIQGDPVDREVGDALLEALKLLCGANPEDRTRRQQGKFAFKCENASYQGEMQSQGTRTGERVLIKLEGQRTRFQSLEELGMRPKVVEQLRELLHRPKGFVLLSAPPGHGLRTTCTTVLQAMDRFTRDFISVEDELNRYESVENVQVKTYNSGQGQTPASILRDVFLLEPGVVIIRDLVDAETVRKMCEEVENDRMLLGAIRANEAAEAYLNVINLGVPPAELGRVLSAIVCQRLIRKLCEHCKEAYIPPAQVLQQLGIPPGRVEVLFRPPQQVEEPCEHCYGTGYYGRTAIFEVMFVDETLRGVLTNVPKLELIRQAARKAGWRSLKEEGALLVANGVTSVAELARVLREPGEARTSPQPG
ncbi:MAG: ATPase, T2SS/T4P/T4SS family [Thermoguttaceae bacterium]|nr:ATPase, T2SS/T4P/T4SS family [Thermoguttaceae bacterium]MDW8080136.1 ATPase, T2SS/T4P/T4SS family [Thermoguttaceae bacterium]